MNQSWFKQFAISLVAVLLIGGGIYYFGNSNSQSSLAEITPVLDATSSSEPASTDNSTSLNSTSTDQNLSSPVAENNINKDSKNTSTSSPLPSATANNTMQLPASPVTTPNIKNDSGNSSTPSPLPSAKPSPANQTSYVNINLDEIAKLLNLEANTLISKLSQQMNYAEIAKEQNVPLSIIREALIKQGVAEEFVDRYMND